MHSPLDPSADAVGCCAFLRRPASFSRHLGYRPLAPLEEPPPPVRVVVGKERRVFLVDPFVLDSNPFRILMEAAGDERSRRKGAVFVDVDAILFEHMLWLAYNEPSSSFSSSASLFQLNLKEIIQFYSQDN
ncbi:hypothetical protein MUK42_22594 [Musa troglodytarum]|uniref:Uncharacterized protein n=1 Tax=Musa troglodytarum TaxID=320322 RepID=A0A9E7FWD5_9LILI|nr:hypothetical protein MUK42_34320 [Musa troglodytarum]URE04451.1 hypothetical protein MUK42_22594 [Musa troglodytarum]